MSQADVVYRYCSDRSVSFDRCMKQGRAIRGTGFAGCSSTLTYLEADSCMLTPEGVSEAVSGGGLEYLNISNLRICVGADGLAMIGAGSATKLRYLNLRMYKKRGMCFGWASHQ
ncbi:hypothetical protein GW17_00033700 [Ensete ventricosum]|nr:hypothetical protein GW17_00033700 [Ensete ventricosum]